MGQQAEAKKVFSYIGFAFLIGLVLTNTLQWFANQLCKEFQPTWLEDPDKLMLTAAFIQYFIGMPVLILLLKRVPAMTPVRKKMKFGSWLVAMMMCMAVAYTSNLVGNLLTTVVGLLKGSMVENVNLTLGSETSLFVNFLVIAVLAPIYEEYIFRKLIVDRTACYGQGVAIVLSGLIFGLAHANLNQFAFAVTIGMFFAFIYLKTGKVRYSIAMHMFFNFFSGVILMGLMRHMNFDEYMSAALENDVDKVMQIVTSSYGAWALFGVCVGFAFLAGIAGLILLILFRKKFYLERAEKQIPKGEGFATVMVNPGMILFTVVFVGMILYQLLFSTM